jgi:hypothetical protein
MIRYPDSDSDDSESADLDFTTYPTVRHLYANNITESRTYARKRRQRSHVDHDYRQHTGSLSSTFSTPIGSYEENVLIDSGATANMTGR